MADPTSNGSPGEETPRRLYNKPNSWIDLHPVPPEPGEEKMDGPPRYVVLEPKVAWSSGRGCAGCVPGCLLALLTGAFGIVFALAWAVQLLRLSVAWCTRRLR